MINTAKKTAMAVLLVISNRLLIILIVFAFMTQTLISRLFDLQIINAELFTGELRQTDLITLPVLAPRGEIYDRMGRPLAVNVTTYTVKLNPSAEFDRSRLNANLYDLLKLFEKNGEIYVDELPLTKEKPYMLTFGDNKTREAMWRRDMEISDESVTGEEIYAELRNKFAIDESLSDEEARGVVSIRSAMYMLRYRKYMPLTLAVNVSDATIAVIEEEQEKYQGLYIESDYIRVYPGGDNFSHLIGYIGKVNANDLETYAPHGYENGDIIGKAGLEQSLELELSGKPGSRMAETDYITGLILKVYNEDVKPEPGNRYYLTVDAYLQDKTFEILESKLTEILINRLLSVSDRDLPITADDLLISMIRANSMPIRKIWQADDTMYSYRLREYVLEFDASAGPYSEGGVTRVSEIIANGVERGNITPYQILLVLIEHGVISATDGEQLELRSGTLALTEFIAEKMRLGEITPQMTNLDPSTGSVVVVDIHTGAVLAAVSYPTYSNDRMTHNLNEYFPLINEDATSPSYYRAFRERRAPGSTFKMITAVAGLEEGSITPYTEIYDEVVFTKAGIPHLRCWSSVSHGNINIREALAVSCNFFFCETAYRLGNTQDGTMNEGIASLNKYMIAFGLNERAGVEIGEAYDTRSSSATTQMQISSPDYKSYTDRLSDKTVNSRWFDGDTVATAIGQGYNNYTAAGMVKYIATLANGGTRYKMYFIDSKQDYFGGQMIKTEPIIEGTVQMSASTLEAVYEGMFNTVHSDYGTGRTVFQDFPYLIAGKTGTAQEIENRNDHTSFAGFAPYGDPQIAIYVVIPFGNTYGTPYAAAYIAKDVIAAYMGAGYEAQIEYAQELNALCM